VKAFCIVLFALGVAVGLGCVNGRDCTLVGCEQGVEIDFRTPYSEAGTYTITVDVDGARTTCTVVLPMTPMTGKPCDQDSVGVRYALSEAGAEKVIASVGLTTTNAKSITVDVAKDGTELAHATFAPTYTTSAGPNGSSCDPQSCTFAQKDFP
jgi:hypothetical protein